MITAEELTKILSNDQVNFFTGVPCSIFKDFLNCLLTKKTLQHLRASSEGEAIGLATGYYLATGKVPLVYMQNSGLGNAVNPLTSLADPVIYSIPMLLFVSWRGEPDIKDEPQHQKMGKIMLDLLKVLEIPYQIFDPVQAKKQITNLLSIAKNKQQPVALVFKEGQIASDAKPGQSAEGMTREEALKVILKKTGPGLIVSTTGKTSREIFEIREQSKQGHGRDFLLVGSMGCASSVALGLNLNTRKRVFCVDGDGAVLMKMGTLATIGSAAPEKFVHIVIDNQAYESTGNQATSSGILNWQKLFQAVGYKTVVLINNKSKLEKLDFKTLISPAAVIVKVIPKSRKDLGRPTTTPLQNRDAFMDYVR